ncbi:MAG: hypothetical protein U1E25_05555 [Methylocystis sp.]
MLGQKASQAVLLDLRRLAVAVALIGAEVVRKSRCGADEGSGIVAVMTPRKNNRQSLLEQQTSDDRRHQWTYKSPNFLPVPPHSEFWVHSNSLVNEV